MEVHIRNVPEQSTDKGLKKFLKPYLFRLSIWSFECQKQRGKRFASLTFLHVSDGERFLAHHGQAKKPFTPSYVHTKRHASSNPATTSSAVSSSRAPGNFPNAVNLTFFNNTIYCEKSNREANGYLLRVLEREQKDRLKPRATNAEDDPRSRTAKVLPLNFNCSAVSCGVWTYSNTDLVYSPQLRLAVAGVAKFREGAIILDLHSGHRIDFRYPSIWDITIDTEDTPSLIISMNEAPHFFNAINNPVAALMSALSLSTGSSSQKRNGPDRHRIPFLSGEHEPIAGVCMVYRLVLTPGENDRVVELMPSLRRVHNMPQIIHRRTEVFQGRQPIAAGLQELRATLSSRSNVGLPFKLKFQVLKLAQNSYLLPAAVISLLPEITRMTERSSMSVCVSAVRKLFSQIPFASQDIEAQQFEPESIIGLLRENEERYNEAGLSLDEVGTQMRSENVAIIHKAKVTPTGTFLYGPEPESNNRILRKYPDHHDYFLRVQFCDEDGQPVRFNLRVSLEKIFHGRFKKVLREGITIADRTYAFLGFSHSSLRAQSCWFMAPFVHNGSLMFEQMLIRDLGDFSVIRSPAKCAARIGQTFSDTPTAVSIDPSMVTEVADVEFKGRVFSDGVGTMSESVRRIIGDKLSSKGRYPPTLYQIRYAGAKGMISLNSQLKRDALVLRPSMIKFDGSNKTDIEICEAAWRPLPLYLNRQFIKILEDMGTDDSFFLHLQAKEVERLRLITESPFNASTFLKRQSVGDVLHLPWLINKLSSLNINFRLDGFLRDVLEMTVLIELRLLKHKTRIPVPQGWHLHGIMDETGFLKEGQIFCVVKQDDGTSKAITGKKLIISRAPALHPGDVQLVEGVLPPQGSLLRDLHNCIVFSQKGARDLPSQLSGGDLDGDRYYLIWDKAATPKRVFKPADYPRVDPIDIQRPVTKDDMTDFFIQFMETDQLGRIAVLHRILADQRDAGTLDKDCITLAEMHSTAVDFSKTGIPVDLTKLPKYSPWRPDFEAPGPHVKVVKKDGISFGMPVGRDPNDDDDDDDFTRYRYYESEKVLGKLYRAIDEREIFSEIQQHSRVPGSDHAGTVMNAVWDHVKRRCRLIQWEHKVEWARGIRDMYEECLLNIMREYSEHPHRPLTELEAFIGNILGKTGAQTKRQRELSTSLKESFDVDAAYIVNCIVKDGEEYSDDSLERSMACLAVSLEDHYEPYGREPLLSFKYLAAAVCLREVDRLPKR